jgi:leader peptidase (prepilin peptidase)/N-methyltransferase
MSHAVALLAISADSINHGLTAMMWWAALVWLACLGGCVGSFLNVVWDRLGSDQGFIFPRSRCPECDHDLRWYHNLPILGWLMLRGRCYDCGARIGIKHLVIETLFAALFVAIGLATPWL